MCLPTVSLLSSVVYCILTHVELVPNDHRADAPHFRESTWYKPLYFIMINIFLHQFNAIYKRMWFSIWITDVPLGPSFVSIGPKSRIHFVTIRSPNFFQYLWFLRLIIKKNDQRPPLVYIKSLRGSCVGLPNVMW